MAWTVINGPASNIYVAQYNPQANGGSGGWQALGNSLSAGGISGTGDADNARIIETATGPVVAWLDSSAGSENVFVKQFVNGQWVALGAGAASGGGVSNSPTSVQGLSLATDGTHIAVAWSETVGNTSQIYLEQYSSGVWTQLGGSAAADGISNSTAQAVTNVGLLQRLAVCRLARRQ